MVETAESAKWEGYVKRALEDIDKKIDGLDEKVDVISKCVNNNKIKIVALSGTVSIVVTLVVLLVKSMLAGGP